MKKQLTLSCLLFAVTFLSAFANRTSVEVTAPADAEKGTEVTVTIQVSHRGNTGLHHTDWVYLKINGVEVKRWEYNRDTLPPDSDFVLEYTFVFSEDVTIEAEGHCNRHGTDGPMQAMVVLREEEELPEN